MKSGKYCMWMKTPAAWEGDMWKEAMPSGNGKIGISVYGATKEETILVNHTALWHWGCRKKVPDISEALKKTREALLKKEYRLANDLMANALTEKI